MNFLTIKLKPMLVYLGIFICAIVLTGFFMSNDSIMTAGKERILPIYNVQRTDKKIAISFDAAWGNIIKRTYKKANNNVKSSAFLYVLNLMFK